MINDNSLPFFKVSCCVLNKLDLNDRLIGFYLGKNKFTNRDFKLLRLNLFLLFELVNEDLEYELSSIFKDRSMSRAYGCITGELDRQESNIRDILFRLEETKNNTEVRHIVLKVTKELMKFFNIIETIYDKYPLFSDGTEFRKNMSIIFTKTKEMITVLRNKCVDELDDCKVVINTLEHSFNSCLDRRKRHEESKGNEGGFTLGDRESL